MENPPTSPAAQLHTWLAQDRTRCAAVLEALYSGKALVKLAGRAGLSYTGHRLEQIPRVELVDAMAAADSPGWCEVIIPEILDAVRSERAAVPDLTPKKAAAWIASAPDHQEGIRRLIAALAFGSPEVSDAAQKWWTRTIASGRKKIRASAIESVEVEGFGQLVFGLTERLDEAADGIEREGRQLRAAVRSLEQAARQREQTLTKQASQMTGHMDQILQELARMRAWLGEQQAALRRAIEVLVEEIKTVRSQVDRGQAQIAGIVGTLGQIGAALDRGRIEEARRQLKRLRAGPQRVGIFVDGANLFFSTRDAHGACVHYGALQARAAQLGEVTVARAYIVDVQDAVAQQMFEAALKGAGFDVRLLPLRRLSDGRVKANWDLGMATDIMRMKGDLDVVLLATGDGDFAELVRWLREEGLRVYVASVRRHTAQDLVDAADGWIPVEDDLLRPPPSPVAPSLGTG